MGPRARDRFDQSEARHGPFGELPVLAETIPDFELVTGTA